MNKISKILVTALLIIAMFCLSALPSFAAVNGNEAPVGSTVEYTLSISGAEQKITGIHLELFYDQTCLELKDVNTDNLSGSTTVNDNQNKDGNIKVVNGLVNGSAGLACVEKTDLVTVTFEVIAEGDSEIKYYIPYLYDYDMVDFYKYTLSQTITVDNNVIAENIPPVLAGDEEFDGVDSFDKGDFQNSPEGTGSGVKVLPTTTQNSDSDSTDKKTDSTATLFLICGSVIVAAVVVLLIVKSKSKPETTQKKSDDE